MMTFSDFRRLWESAGEYTPEQHDLYVAERGWQDWMDEYGAEDADAIVRVLDAVYTMAHGGFASIRSITGLSQRGFEGIYGIPYRSVQNWEAGINTPTTYNQILLGYAVLTDQLARITAARAEEE